MFDILFWIGINLILLIFIFWQSYKLGFRLGYKKGAKDVLDQWKEIMGMGGPTDE
jgi:hypothetical protein